MGVGAVILLCAVVFVIATATKAPGDNPTATSTEQVATTTDIFTMEPIVPEAKVSTEGWKTCRNEEYGWEVKYPGDWYVYGEGHAKVSPPIDWDNEDGGEIEAGVWGSVYAYETPCVGGDVRIASWTPGTGYAETLRNGMSFSVRADQEMFGTAGAAYRNVYDIATASPETARFFFTSNDHEFLWRVTGDVVDIWAFHNGNRYEILGSERDADLLETILTTFHFLDTASSTASTTPPSV